MITSIRLVNFKNFKDETLHLGPFTVLVGANASGKSNIRDAFRFIHGIGRGYTLAEIMGGKYGPGGQVEWEPIRGATNEIIRFEESRFSFEIKMKLQKYTARYFIEISKFENSHRGSNEFRIEKESLKIGRISYTAEFDPDYKKDSKNLVVHVKESGNKNNKKLEKRTQSNKPFISQISDIIFDFEMEELRKFLMEDIRKREEEKEPTKSKRRVKPPRRFQGIRENIQGVINILESTQFLDLSPRLMRQPVFPGHIALGDSGENLPVVLEDICTDPKRKIILTNWLSELTPMDVVDFEFERDPSGRIHLMIREANKRKVSAYSASDGTLRFLAMLAMLLSDNPMGLCFFEEIDNGIHPSRQWLLLELIENQVKKRQIQVVTTTHSPGLLNFASDDTFDFLSVVGRLEDSDDAIIRSVSEFPNAKELRTSQGIGHLLTAGWIEDMLAFHEKHNENEEEAIQ